MYNGLGDALEMMFWLSIVGLIAVVLGGGYLLLQVMWRLVTGEFL